jgi:Immunity protein Imm1
MPLFVKTLSESVATGNKMESTERRCESLQDVEQAIARLDGASRSELVLVGDDDTVMMIGGGANQQFVATVAIHVDQALFDLLRPGSPADGDGEVKLLAGGQWGVYAQRQVVDLDLLLRAAMTFARTGQPDSSLNWQSE